jgi:transcription-repair coupling factor (superfamily II helicase)
VATIHRNGPDVVLTYRSEKRIKQLVDRTGGRLKVVDEQSAYLRLRKGEDETLRLYELLKQVLQSEPTG